MYTRMWRDNLYTLFKCDKMLFLIPCMWYSVSRVSLGKQKHKRQMLAKTKQKLTTEVNSNNVGSQNDKFRTKSKHCVVHVYQYNYNFVYWGWLDHLAGKKYYKQSSYNGFSHHMVGHDEVKNLKLRGSIKTSLLSVPDKLCQVLQNYTSRSILAIMFS